MIKKLLMTLGLLSIAFSLYSSDSQPKRMKLDDENSVNCNSPLLEAYIAKNFDAVKNYIAQGANPQILLFPAVYANDLSAITYLKGLGIDLNQLNQHGESALIICIAKKFNEIVKFLLNAQVDLEVQSLKGETAISFAIMNCICGEFQMELVRYLLSKMKKIDFDHREIKDKYKYGNSEYNEIAGLLVEMASSGKVEFVGSHVLFYAIYFNDITLLKKAILQGADTSILTEENMENLLDFAVQRSNVEIISFLITIGFDINHSGESGFTPLMSAWQNHSPNVKSFLLDLPNADLSKRTNGGWSVLTYFGLEYFWQIYNDARFARDGEDYNELLRSAVESRRLDIIIELMDKPGINVHSTDYDHFTALTNAVRSNNLDVLKLILTKVPCFNFNDRSPMSLASSGCESYFNLACNSDAYNVVDYAMKHQSVNINERDKQGNKSFRYANDNGYITAQRLLSYGANLLNHNNEVVSYKYICEKIKKCLKLIDIPHYQFSNKSAPLKEMLLYYALMNKPEKLSKLIYDKSNNQELLNPNVLPYLDCAFNFACKFKILSIVTVLYKALKEKYANKPGKLNMLRLNGIKAFAPTDQGHELMVDVLNSLGH